MQKPPITKVHFGEMKESRKLIYNSQTSLSPYLPSKNNAT